MRWDAVKQGVGIRIRLSMLASNLQCTKEVKDELMD